MKKLSPLLLPEAKAFSLDFHPIPYRGEAAVLENYYVPARGQAGPRIQSFFAQEHENQVSCYANASLTRDEQAHEVIRSRFSQADRLRSDSNAKASAWDFKAEPCLALVADSVNPVHNAG